MRICSHGCFSSCAAVCSYRHGVSSTLSPSSCSDFMRSLLQLFADSFCFYQPNSASFVILVTSLFSIFHIIYEYDEQHVSSTCPPEHYWEDPSIEHYGPCASSFQPSFPTLLPLSSLSLPAISLPHAQLANSSHSTKSMLQHLAVTEIILAICVLWFWRLCPLGSMVASACFRP